ncbi:Lipid-A-disaccharide synthase [Geitlerinema sp. FC II]|nr:Lipid-A-disaccharide synthase [Geitlerinema sp. FC II]
MKARVTAPYVGYFEMSQPFDLLILSNGPGEIATWVRPVVEEVRRQFENVRISVILSPCPHASGREADIVASYPEVDRVQGAAAFWDFLLWGKTAEHWEWRDRGVVLFLGGDRLFPVIVGKRLGYRIVVYAEWEAQWYRWVDRFGVATQKAIDNAPKRYAHKLSIVGNLMADARGDTDANPDTANTTLGFLPGSKPLKLTLGVPLSLAIADRIHPLRPDVQFIVPVAPTVDLETLAKYADPQFNRAISALNWPGGEPIFDDGIPYLVTSSGVKLRLWTQTPATEVLQQCALCITTVGANTAELAALAVPMLVLLPTHRLDIMRAWDGIPGLLAHLPGVGDSFTKLFTWIAWKWLDRQAGGSRLAWPNIWANEQIVPEFVGQFPPEDIARYAVDLLNNPAELDRIRQNLTCIRGEPGAAEKLVKLLTGDGERGTGNSHQSPVTSHQ